MANNLPTIDKVWGIDRYKASECFGELVVPNILLWRKPACKPIEDNLTGAIKHGTEVIVSTQKKRKNRNFFFVETEVLHEGKTYLQKGWISAMLLEGLGKDELIKEQGNG